MLVLVGRKIYKLEQTIVNILPFLAHVHSCNSDIVPLETIAQVRCRWPLWIDKHSIDSNLGFAPANVIQVAF